MTAVGRIASLHRYPVKSMGGERLETCAVTEAGLIGDRGYALVDAETGKMVSAKRPQLWPDLLEFGASFVAEPTAGGPLPPAAVTFPDGSSTRTDDPDAERRITDHFRRKVALATSVPPGALVEELWLEDKGPNVYGDQHPEDDGLVTDFPASFVAPPGTHFDFSAMHLLTTSTLDALRRAHPSAGIDERRFRPNLVVETDGDGFVENDWKGVLEAGDVRIELLIPTPRCVMTTLAQGDLERDPGVLRAMAQHNMIRAGGLGELPCAGIYGSVAAGGTLRVGDEVAIEPSR